MMQIKGKESKNEILLQRIKVKAPPRDSNFVMSLFPCGVGQFHPKHF